ncbi:hypothetical protein [Verrucomicrobium sp. BvORR106]|uniref:hypothetical protein n=1 Tax=Verrucomicrobium sp. BvORR106 TaxID=1403819 RepID=UPI000570FE61|nr:hypothetical protein [Verrucomicrobium sp. BvORR106]
MKKTSLSSLALVWWVAVLMMLPTAVVMGDEQAEKGFALMKEEALNEIRLEMPQQAVLKVLGKPAKKGEDVEWEAIGEHVQEWQYPAQGVTLQMASVKKGGAKKVLCVAQKAPGALATRKGLRIGSSEAEVRKAYGALEDKEASRKGEIFVAGTVYGGLVFHFEKGKVSEIFLGAMAE